jgi:hypothetical protein
MISLALGRARFGPSLCGFAAEHSAAMLSRWGCAEWRPGSKHRIWFRRIACRW